MKALHFTIMLSFLITAILVSGEASGQACTASTSSYCDGNIDQDGKGAVELCENCFVCGADDGVCPELYSDGSVETRTERRTMFMKASTSSSERPSVENAHTLIYNTGNEACAVIGGECLRVEQRTTMDASGSWSTTGGVTCSTDISSNPHYYQAICQGVPRTASCDNCPDPDCLASIRGVAYSAHDVRPMEDVRIQIRSRDNPDVDMTIAEAPSQFVIDPSWRGNLVMECTRPGYLPYIRDIRVQPGENIFDCRMEEAQCTPECTLPHIDGQEVCRSICQGQNGCDFGADPSICEGRTPGSTVITDHDYNDTHVQGVVCCDGAIEPIFRPRFQLSGDDIRSLITRDYRREINGVPVTLKIIVYSRD